MQGCIFWQVEEGTVHEYLTNARMRRGHSCIRGQAFVDGSFLGAYHKNKLLKVAVEVKWHNITILIINNDFGYVGRLQ